MAVQGLRGGFPADIFAQQPVPDFLICPSCKHVRVNHDVPLSNSLTHHVIMSACCFVGPSLSPLRTRL